MSFGSPSHSFRTHWTNTLCLSKALLAEAERDAAIALERAIYGDLFPVVPNIENRNNFAALN